MNDCSGSYGFPYDNMGRLIGTTTHYAFLPGHTFTNTYAYDAASNRVSLSADGSTTTYQYDMLNRLSDLTNAWAGHFSLGYDSLSRRTALNRPNGINTSYSYDSLSRLLSVLHQAGGTTIDGAGYAYDAAGNRTSKTNYLNSTNEQYTYDLIYQLTQVTGSPGESYTYDAVGNRLSSAGVPTYSYNSSSQLTSTTVATFAYDYNGSTTSKTDANGTTGYAWDFENRLTSITLPNNGGTVTFKYDPFGRRIEKISPTTTIVFAYNGANIVGEYDSAGNAVVLYAQGPGIDEPLALSKAGAISYYEADGLGSVTSLTDSSGSAVAAYTRDNFGKALTTADTIGNRFRYTAREWDDETGLYYYRARYYDPVLGRFITEDPTGVGGSISPFAYTDNNPLRWTDPFGLIPRAPRCPSSRQDISRSELERLIGPVSPTDSANLNRGCIGMTSVYQGMNVTFPENARGTKCFATEAQARAHPCKPSEKKFIFAKQGQYQHGAPIPGPNGEVPRDTISSAGGNYNYIVAFPGGCYGWMNNGVYPGADPQMASISPTYPHDAHYPHTIWCSTCCSKCLKSR